MSHLAVGNINRDGGGNCGHLTVGLGIAQRSVSNGAMTSGSANLDSATAAWAAATDNGRLVVVRGAGPSGGLLIATILSRTSASRVVLSQAASTTVSGAVVQILSYREVTDAAITSGTAILTSATANFVNGGDLGTDVGKRIAVGGAGAAGAILAATISSVDSPTQVTINVNASTTVSGQTLRIPRTYRLTDKLSRFSESITDADLVGALLVWSKLAVADGRTIAEMEGQTAVVQVP